jgi:predicted enzyme related to lactoylglutathione lyase
MTYLAGGANAVVDRVPEAGGKVLMPPLDVEGSGRMAIIADPGGAAVGVWESGNHIGAELVNEPVSMIWNEVNTPDMKATAEFLEQAFGVEIEDVPMVESGYKIFKVDGEPRGGILQMTEEWEGVPPHWMTYFAVNDTDATCAAIRDAGGLVSIEPFYAAFGRMAVVNDPQGAVFMVRG